MKVIVGFEESGRVRQAFRDIGHDAWSCDLEPAADDSPYHHQGDIFEFLDNTSDWDLGIFHPVCTYLCLSSAKWFYHPDDKHLANEDKRPHPDYPDRVQQFEQGIETFLRVQRLDIPKICIENSIPLGRTIHHAGRPSQVIQPWWFGSPYTKGAALWLKGLKPLVATHEKPAKIIAEAHEMAPGKERAKLRSRTDPAVAGAMAQQWGTEFDPTTLRQGSLF